MHIQPRYETRFIRAEHIKELINLWHLSRVACSYSGSTRYDRMIWTCKEFSKTHKDVSSMGVYKDLCGLLDL